MYSSLIKYPLHYVERTPYLMYSSFCHVILLLFIIKKMVGWVMGFRFRSRCWRKHALIVSRKFLRRLVFYTSPLLNKYGIIQIISLPLVYLFEIGATNLLVYGLFQTVNFQTKPPLKFNCSILFYERFVDINEVLT